MRWLRARGTAQAAADAIGCLVDQIAKSIIFFDPAKDRIVLFITAGGNQVDAAKAATVSGATLDRADAKIVRAMTGFAIGGVAPIGHLTEPVAFFDPRLLEFETVWAAAGTPHHVFGVEPKALLDVSGATTAEFVE